MAYHIFKVFPNKSVDHVQTIKNYREAKQLITELRAKLELADNYSLKMVFATNPHTAAKLLTAEREFIPYGDD